jgi:hypothetical protein
MSASMYCASCGTQILANQTTCRACGANHGPPPAILNNTERGEIGDGRGKGKYCANCGDFVSLNAWFYFCKRPACMVENGGPRFRFWLGVFTRWLFYVAAGAALWTWFGTADRSWSETPFAQLTFDRLFGGILQAVGFVAAVVWIGVHFFRGIRVNYSDADCRDRYELWSASGFLCITGAFLTLYLRWIIGPEHIFDSQWWLRRLAR